MNSTIIIKGESKDIGLLASFIIKKHADKFNTLEVSPEKRKKK